MNLIFQQSKKSFLPALILLSAILSGMFSFSFHTSTQLNTAEMVYCPLTKKLQPIRAFNVNSKQNLLDEYCVSEKEKAGFSSEIIKKIRFSFSIFNETNFENLVFDYFRIGKSAFDVIPNLPNFPEKKLVKKSFSTSGLSNSFNTQITGKAQEQFSFQLKPRPPTIILQTHFEFLFSQELKKISKNINPRSPPFSA